MAPKDLSQKFVNIDLTKEMSSPPAWVPGRYLTGGEKMAVIDIGSPVYDPVMEVRGQRSSLLGSVRGSPHDSSYKSVDNLSRIPRGTVYLILACCGVATFALGLLAYIQL